MKDIAPELLEKLQENFKKEFNSNEKIKQLNKLITEKKATYQEANALSVEVGNILARVYQNNLSSEILPDGKMYYNIAQRIIQPTMQQNYELVSAYSQEVQTTLNKEAKIGIKGIKPDLNQDRVDGIIERVSSEDYFDDVKWILDEPVKNFTQSVVDDAVKANADFQFEAGLKPKIIRKEVGNCCPWCKEVVGVYEYPKVPEAVYRRHRYCRCTVEYDPGDGKRQDVHSKKWIDPEKEEKLLDRKKIANTDFIQANRLKNIAHAKARELGYDPIPQEKVVEVLREDSKKWIEALTEDEKKAISKYTYNGKDEDGLRLFEKINGYLEGRYIPENKIEEEVLSRNYINIQKALLKNRFKNDIITYRYEDDLDRLEGAVNKFLSTSVTQKGVLGSKPNSAIIVPKGTDGAYIELLAAKGYEKQREFLLARGTVLEQIENKDIDLFIVKRGMK